METSALENSIDKNQRLISFSAVIGAVFLAVQHILIEAHAVRWLSIGASLLAATGWMIYLYAFFKAKSLLSSDEGKVLAEQMAGDERLLAIRAESFTWGFAAMIGFQVVLLVAYMMLQGVDTHVMSIPVAATSTIAAGVTGATLRQLNLSKR